jgi:hypothetical protein
MVEEGRREPDRATPRHFGTLPPWPMAEGRELGDVTTLRDPDLMQRL